MSIVLSWMVLFTAPTLWVWIPADDIDTQKLFYNGQADYWWLRSPYLKFDDRDDLAWVVTPSGVVDDNHGVWDSYGRNRISSLSGLRQRRRFHRIFYVLRR